MGVTIDASELADKLAAVHRAGKAARVAVVVPLSEGYCDVVRDFLAEGPPFDPEAVGLARHQVFLTEREAIFLFDSPDGAQPLLRILEEPDFWGAASAWQRCCDSEPRLGTEAYSWPEHRCSASEG